MTSSKYYKGLVKEDYTKKRGTDIRKKVAKKKKAKETYTAKRRKSLTDKYKSRKAAQDSGSSTAELVKAAEAKDRKQMLKDRAEKSAQIKAAKAEEKARMKEHRAEKERNLKLIEDKGWWPLSSDKGYGKHAPKARSFMTPSRKGKKLSDFDLMMTLKKQEHNVGVPDAELSAQELYERRRRNKKASGGSVKKKRKAMNKGGSVKSYNY